MIPFSIMSNTNILPPRVDIKKIYGVYNSVMYLDSNGDLWGYGNNTSGAMGSIPSGYTFTLIESGVDDVWSACTTADSSQHVASTIIRKGTNMYWSGLGGLFGNTSYSTKFSQFTNCTSYFTSAGIDVLQIKKISLACTVRTTGNEYSGCKCFVLMNNGNLYFMGRNLGKSAGLGLANYALQSTFALSSQNVLDIDCDVHVSVLINSSNVALYSGTNLQNGTANAAGSWSTLSSFTPYSTVMCGYQNAFLIGSTLGSVYGTGFTNNNNLNTTNLGSGWSTVYNIYDPSGKTLRVQPIYSISKVTVGAPRSFVGKDGLLYSAGDAPYIGTGNVKNTTLSPVSRPDLSSIKLVASSGFNSWYVNSNNEIYGTGTYLPGNVTSYVYTKIV